MAKSGETNQKTLRAFAVYLAFVVVGGAFLAPWLWYLGQYLIASDILPQLKPFGFAKYPIEQSYPCDCGSLAFLEACRDVGPRAVWDCPEPQLAERPLGGPGGSAGYLLACGLVGVGLDYRKWTTGLPKVSTVVAVFAAVAVVSPLEEGLFRGVLLSALLRRYQLQGCHRGAAAIFASLHFLKPTKAYRSYAGEVEPWTGFELLPHFLDLANPRSSSLVG